MGSCDGKLRMGIAKTTTDASESVADPRVIIALDFSDAARALSLAARLDPRECALKVGKELFVAQGPEPVRRMVARGFRVFLDLKFHDIPNTAAQACAAASALGVWMINVHASGGRSMMLAAREAVTRAAEERRIAQPLLVAVTLLTSLGEHDLAEIGIHDSTQDSVLRLASLAAECGLDGVVCSAAEAAPLRRAMGPTFKLVTPGIRPGGAHADDQARIATPQDAIANGADYLVIGRPITAAADPLAALRAINASIEALA